MPNPRSKSRSTTKPTRQARLPKKSDLVVAIDFGTTYTGVAFAYDLPHAPHLERRLTPEQLRDKVTVLKSWPGVAGSYSDKVPSILAYDSNGQVTAWGGNVNSSHLMSVAHFKLGLEKGVGGYYSINTDPDTQSPLEKILANESWKHPDLPNKDAFHHTENFLREIHQYILTEALPKDFGQAFLSNVSIRYVLTVPAIWSDMAKDLTRKAATLVGIAESDLTMVTEPEAAALYCATLCHEAEIKNGDYFLVCDAGGGTVVIRF
jgi:molecular chaperone DnaK (HSP70)